MTGTSTLEVYDPDILVAETGMIVCSMQVAPKIELDGAGSPNVTAVHYSTVQ